MVGLDTGEDHLEFGYWGGFKVFITNATQRDEANAQERSWKCGCGDAFSVGRLVPRLMPPNQVHHLVAETRAQFEAARAHAGAVSPAELEVADDS